MPRRKAVLHSGETYHVYNRGVARQPIFFTTANWAFFINRLRDIVAHCHEILAYCLMPNHYHLVLRVGDLDPSAAMQRLGTSYTKSVNLQEARVGPLFQSRFQAVHVDSEEYLLHLSRYVHRNPVEAGLVATPEDWEYSSYRDYIGLRGGTLPVREPIMTAFRDEADYRSFVEAGDVASPVGFDEITLDAGEDRE